jgi:integrase/bifunctional DNA-binding transcriptional regulator/antitoxin component of YhaV-PrlF toxin-antitoxin module
MLYNRLTEGRCVMVKGLVKVGKKHQVQFGVPKDVRKDFGISKYTKMIHTSDEREAELIAERLEREFRAQVLQSRQNALQGDYLDPLRAQQVVGWVFGQLFGQHEEDRGMGPDLDERIAVIIRVAQHEGHPMMQGVHTAGVIFDGIVKSVEVLLETSERGSWESWEKTRKVERPAETLLGAFETWSKIAKQRPKTIEQYGSEVRRFSEWFKQSYGPCYGRAITEQHVNLYIEFRMRKGSARATINHSLSALRLIFKAGRYAPKNPFAGVHDRMIVEGDRLEVRAFKDEEMRALLGTNGPDRTAVLIAAYSGLRVSEITALKVKHVQQVGETFVFDLRAAGHRKTKASYRRVPIHPVLMEVIKPLLRDDPDQRLVPNWNAGTLSKRLGRLIDTVTEDADVRAHSFRHTFLTKLAEAGVGKELRRAIAGHAGTDIADRYTHTDFMNELSRHIEKVRYD